MAGVDELVLYVTDTRLAFGGNLETSKCPSRIGSATVRRIIDDALGQ
jgi:hypothetical protein